MNIKTKRFGEIKVVKENILEFEQGLFAFEDLRSFVLLDIEKNPVFKWLQSIDNTDISFLLVDPFVVKKDYFIDLDDFLLEELEIENKEDVLIYTTVTVPRGVFKEATTNLLGPLVINWRRKKGKQVILERDDVGIKHPLFSPENREMKKVSCGG